MDANKTAGEETRWQLHKNAACNPEQVLAATPHKTPNCTATCPASRKLFKLGEPDMQDIAGEAGDELIRDVLLWIPTHGRAKAGRPARTYIQQLCEDTGCCPEDLSREMNDRGGVAREGQRYPSCQHDMMMMMIYNDYFQSQNFIFNYKMLKVLKIRISPEAI